MRDMKYAVVQTGGKQYKVSEGDELDVEKFELKEGEKFNLDKVLLLVEGERVWLGSPLVSGAKVTVEVLKSFKGKKIRGLKYKSDIRYRKHYGHRQELCRIRVQKIASPK